MGLFDFLKDWKPKIKPEWKKRGWVSEDELREYNFSPKMVKVFKERDEEKRTGLLTWEYSATLALKTPKIYLEKDGEVLKSATEPELFGEPTSYLPDGQPINKYGLWIRTFENYKDFGYEEGEYDIHISDKKELLNFLIGFEDELLSRFCPIPHFMST